MNNIEHFVHPGFLRDIVKARATLELAKTAVQLDPVNSRAHLCCGWSYAMALREAEAAPHMELACELNDNDPWTLLSSAAYFGFCGSIELAELRAASRSPFRWRLQIWNGAITVSSAICAATLPVRLTPSIARKV